MLEVKAGGARSVSSNAGAEGTEQGTSQDAALVATPTLTANSQPPGSAATPSLPPAQGPSGGKPGRRAQTVAADRQVDTTRWAYTIHRVEGSRNPDVIYFFPAIDGDARMWIDDLDQAFKLAWQGHNRNLPETWRKDPPTIVTVAMDPKVFSLRLLDTVGGDGGPGKLQTFAEVILPEIEARLEATPAKRHVVGFSMGGFNALQLLWHRPEMVASVALISPMLPPDPYEPGAAERYVKRSGADEFDTDVMVKLLRDEYEHLGEWRDADPHGQAKKLTVNSPPLHVFCNSGDHFGFFENTVTFAATAREAGAKVDQVVAAGDHGDNLDMASLVGFLFEQASANRELPPQAPRSAGGAIGGATEQEPSQRVPV